MSDDEYYGEREEGDGETGTGDESGEDGRRPKGYMVDDINVTDSQVMIQLKEAEDEAEGLRKEIAVLRSDIERYERKKELNKADSEALQDKQISLMEKISLLDELTKRISKLMEFAAKRQGEETTILDEEEEEEGLPDDILPRVVICSSWDDMMPKVVVCMDMKKPGLKKLEGDRDENGLTPEQREALEKERRCMAEERNRLQYQIASLEGEMRVMMRENDILGRKVAQLKADAENQPPFEFEMSVSATQAPGTGVPKGGNMDTGIGVMGLQGGGNFTMGAALALGGEMQGKMAIPGPPYAQSFAGDGRCPCPSQNNMRGTPCAGPAGQPNKSRPCPAMAEGGGGPMVSLPPFGKKCRKDFVAVMGPAGMGGGSGGGGCFCNPGGGGMKDDMSTGMKPPMDLNFKVNVTPQNPPQIPANNRQSVDASARSNKIAQQLQDIEQEVRRMQKELSRAKKDKDILRGQQATLNCAKTSIM